MDARESNMSARDDYPITARLARFELAGDDVYEARQILDEVDRLRALVIVLAHP